MYKMPCRQNEAIETNKQEKNLEQYLVLQASDA